MTTEPALADEVTAQLHALSVRRARLRVLTAVVVPVLVAAVVWVLVAATREFVGAFWSVVLTVLLVGIATVAVSQVRTPPGVGGWVWRPAPRRLLAEQPWRETPVKVLNLRGTVLVLPDGVYVRVSGLPAAARGVVVRTRRVWTVGPDAEGRLAVRVEGLYTPWPARRIPPRPGTAALPADGRTTAMTARHAEVTSGRVTTGVLAVLSLLALMSGVLAVLGGAWTDYLQTAVYVLLAVAFLARVRYLRQFRPSAPWVRVEAATPSWRARGGGLASGTVTVTFPDGRRRTAQLDRAPLDLFANVVREKGLWVAGDRVAGFPDYAVVATVRLR